MRYKNHKGATLVEAIMAIAIIMVILFGVLSSYPTLVHYSLTTINSVSAGLLLEEGVEAVKTIRDAGYTANLSTLTASTTYYLNFSGGVWTVGASAPFIDNYFERGIVLYEVYRDANNNITTSGGTLDPDTKLLRVTVGWADGGVTTTRSISTYVTNLFDE